MLMEEPTLEMIKGWKEVWYEYKDKLRPNRKSGKEIVEYLKSKYHLKEILGHNKWTEVVIDNVLCNEPFAEKIPIGTKAKAVTFIVQNKDNGKFLYDSQDEIFKGINIFVGVELESGVYIVEGSSMLFDELCAFQGLDEKDIQNYYCVAEYISCLKRFGLLESRFDN